jgi:urate oxidase
VLATTVNARWRHRAVGGDWNGSYAKSRRQLLAAFADTKSLSLQQTLYAMGARVLEARPELCEVRLSLPNRHHFLVDLSPFGIANETEDGAVYYAADRPYGLIEGTVLCADAADAGTAWD